MRPDHKNDLVGCYIKPDEWKIGNNLMPSNWDKAEYRLPLNSGGPIKTLAVNIKITGRTHRFTSHILGPAMRCQITIVGDDEPDDVMGGWIKWEV